MTTRHPLLRAIELVGQSNLARACEVTPQTMYGYRKLAEADPQKLVPAGWARPIERATRRRVLAKELRPDLYA